MKYPDKKDFELAKMIGISPQTFANWGRHDGVTRLPNAETLYLGYKALGILSENGSPVAGAPAVLSGAAGNAVGGLWPARGCAAADDSNGSRVPDSDEEGEPVPFPSGMTLVPVQGDSMSPLFLPGQYAMIDRDREGHEVDGGVVVVSIVDKDWERKEKKTGTFVKRCFKGDGFFYFTSINSSYAPFSAWQDHCRIWPVLGVWFGGRGTPPQRWAGH